MANQPGKTLRVKLVRSLIGTLPKQRECLKGLGLARINQERELQDTPHVRGLIFRVQHMVTVDPPVAQK